MRHLLKHTSGLKHHQRIKFGEHGFTKGSKIHTLNEVSDGKSPLQPITFDSEPGASFKYSNQGYNLIQKIIEDVTEKPFEVVAEDVVLSPFNMNNSTFKTVYPDTNNTSYCYAYKDEVVHKELYKNTVSKCSGGLFSTSEDLAKFCLKVNDIINGKDDFLNPELAKQILENDGYSLGFDIELI